MAITSETFHRAECDADGCGRVFPDNDDEGASHYPMDSLIELMAEERGEFDEHWTITADGKTYCPKHTPGNIDCTGCRGEGFIKTNPAGKTFEEVGWQKCARCEGRGYLTNETTGGKTK